MAERSSYEPGTFSWVDLAAADVDAAKEFYGRVFGWTFEDADAGGGAVYSMARLGGRRVAAVYAMREEQRQLDIPPHWDSYVTVESADAAAARAEECGGTALSPAFDVLDAGRLAVLQDPTGAPFVAWEPRENAGAELVNVPGALTWNELATNDVERAARFYSALFGWRVEELDTQGGPRYWSIAHEGAAGGRNGGMRELSDAEEGVPPHWLPYFAVDSAEASVATATELGARSLVGPLTIPTGTFAVVCDPQGARFALFEGEFDD